VRQGGSVLLDWGARLSGYCSDLTRTICVDRIRELLGGLVEVVLAAQDAVLENLKPGRSCGDADAAGRAVIARAGRGRCFGHGMGHGVGLAVHEAPRLGPRSAAVLLPGMVVTVEPGVYLPGEAGVRVEELVLITPDGHEVLTSLPRTPEALGARAHSPLVG
jgi:Xaa-Pro aminopeptidase